MVVGGAYFQEFSFDVEDSYADVSPKVFAFVDEIGHFCGEYFCFGEVLGVSFREAKAAIQAELQLRAVWEQGGVYGFCVVFVGMCENRGESEFEG